MLFVVGFLIVLVSTVVMVLVGYWAFTWMMVRRKVEFDQLNLYAEDQRAKIQVQLTEAQSEYSRFAMNTAVSMAEQIGKTMLEVVPKAVETTVRGIFDAERFDLSEKSKMVQDAQERADEAIDRDDDQWEWWNKQDESFKDPFAKFVDESNEQQEEAHAPSLQQQLIRAQRERD